jgi:predicted XRE-type DNA-binding protein
MRIAWLVCQLLDFRQAAFRSGFGVTRSQVRFLARRLIANIKATLTTMAAGMSPARA